MKETLAKIFVQQRFYWQFERHLYLRVIAIIIPTNLGISFLIFLCFPFLKPKNSFPATWWSCSKKYFNFNIWCHMNDVLKQFYCGFGYFPTPINKGMYTKLWMDDGSEEASKWCYIFASNYLDRIISVLESKFFTIFSEVTSVVLVKIFIIFSLRFYFLSLWKL